MCGIFLYKGDNGNASEIVMQGLKDLEYRGYDSWGIVSLDGEKKLKLQKYVGKVSESDMKFDKSNLAFGHTRWATHGKVTKENSHPHISNDRRFVIAHNGIFENYAIYKKKLLNKGVKFYSETDTEVLVNLIQEEGFKNIFKKIKGGNAFIVLDTKTEGVFVGRNGSPLYVGKREKELFVSSDRLTIMENAKEIYAVKEGELLNLGNLGKIKFQKINKITQDKNSILDFQHFTLKEIFDQKKVSGDAYTKNKSLESVFGKNWAKNKSIFASGCGTAYNAALVFTKLAEDKGINVKALPANESDNLQKILDKKSILFLFSQSGETADSIVFAKQVLKKGGKVYSVLNAEYSTLSQISTKSFYINSGKEVAVASTKAFTSMVFTSLRLLDFKVSKNIFVKLDKFVNIELISEVKKIVSKYKNLKDIFIIGKGVESIIALEQALKIKETSYIHAEGFAAGELKHGVLALIEKGILSIVLSGDKSFSKEMDNATQQIKARHGEVLGIGWENRDSYDYFVKIPELRGQEYLSYIFVNVVGQILAYEFSIQRGINPDTPRNLAKSVTVR